MLLVSPRAEKMQKNEGFLMIGSVTSLGEKLEVEVISDEYNSGTFLIIYSDDIKITKDGKRADTADISVGDILEIKYNGQVMLSLPPQIVARAITIK